MFLSVIQPDSHAFVFVLQIQLGNITVPKSVTKSRLEENRDIFDFELSQEDMDTLDGLDANGRTCCVPG